MLESEKFDLIMFLLSLPLLGIIVYELYSSFFRKGYHSPMAIEKVKYRNAAQVLFFIYSFFICFWPIFLLIGRFVILTFYGKGPADAGGGIILTLPILIFSFIFDIVVSIAFTLYVFEPVKNSYESFQAAPKSNILSKSSKHAIVALVFVIIGEFFMILQVIK